MDGSGILALTMVGRFREPFVRYAYADDDYDEEEFRKLSKLGLSRANIVTRL